MQEKTRGWSWFFFSAATAVLFGLFYWRSVDLITPFIMGDDSSQYFLLSRSILQGDGYRSIWVDGSPPHVKFPFGLPLLFALASFFGPGGWGAAFLVPVISATGAVFMIFCLLRDRELPVIAWGIAVLTGMSSLMYLYAHSLLSEVPFLFFLMTALFFADRFIRKSQSRSSRAAGRAEARSDDRPPLVTGGGRRVPRLRRRGSGGAPGSTLHRAMAGARAAGAAVRAPAGDGAGSERGG